LPILCFTAEPEAPDRGGSNEHPARLQRQDCTLVAWYRFLYAPRTGGAYDSHHRTAGIAGRTRGAAAAWPLAVRAEQADRVRRLATMMGGRNADTDPEGRAWFSVFRQGLQDLGWIRTQFSSRLSLARGRSRSNASDRKGIHRSPTRRFGCRQHAGGPFPLEGDPHAVAAIPLTDLVLVVIVLGLTLLLLLYYWTSWLSGRRWRGHFGKMVLLIRQTLPDLRHL
jgi:hypothetical protein